MNYTQKVGFALINSNGPIPNTFIRNLKLAFWKNKDLFRKSIPLFKIIICCSENEYQENSKRDYEKWSTATVLKNRTLVIRNQKEYRRISSFKKNIYYNILTHELNHLFWLNFYERMNPIWLFEGLACHIGKTRPWSRTEVKSMIKKYQLNSSILEYRMLNKNFKKGHEPRYPVWAYFCQFFAKKYSIKKLIKIMEQKPTKTEFWRLFEKNIGKTQQQIFAEFIVNL